MNPRDKQRVVIEVTERVTEAYASDPRHLEQAIFDALYEERRRLETERDRTAAARQAAFYDRIQSQALRSDDARHRELLREIVSAFANEIVGHFDERLYSVSTRAVPAGLSMLLSGMSPLRLAQTLRLGTNALQQHLEVSGAIDAAQRCARTGTVVLVPTHLSNLDSIVIGYGLFRMGLPPFLYGAGLNLFHNRLIGFFMNRLGAYKVDRRKKALLYKDVLKTYAEYSLELGYHNLFGRLRWPLATEFLFGDDVELDALVYALYARLLAGEIAGTQLESALREKGVGRTDIRCVAALASELPRERGKVARIFVHLQRDTPPEQVSSFGKGLAPVRGAFQMALALFEMDRVQARVVTAAADAQRRGSRSAVDLDALARDAIVRELVSAEKAHAAGWH